MVCTLYIYHKLSLEVHACVLSSTVNVCISNTWTPFLCYVSSHSKVSHSTVTNSMYWRPSFTNRVKKFHPFYGTPFLCHKSLPLVLTLSQMNPLISPSLFKNNFTTIVPPGSEPHKCSLTFRVSGPSFLHISSFTMHAECCVHLILHLNTITVFYTLQVFWIKFCWLFMNLPHVSYILSPLSSSVVSP